MADTKITALTALTAADPANDVIPIVDVSDTSMAASGTTKKISVNNILGASGTATLASATITGAATVGTTLGVTGVSTLASAVVTGALTSGTTTLVSHAAGYTGKVGIGTATPNNTLTINGTAATWNKGAYIIYSDAGSTYIGGLGNGGSIFGSGTDNDIGITTGGATNLRLGTNNTEQMRITSAGNVNISTGNVVMGTSGKGIDFAATSGTGTSELLADYEEGTWTPTFTASVPTLTTVTSSSANYTKIGRRVSIDIDFTLTNIGTASGVLSLTLPFTRSSANDTCGAFREISVVGSMGSIYGEPSDLTKVSLSFYNNTSVIVNGYRFNGTYSYNV